MDERVDALKAGSIASVQVFLTAEEKIPQRLIRRAASEGIGFIFYPDKIMSKFRQKGKNLVFYPVRGSEEPLARQE